MTRGLWPLLSGYGIWAVAFGAIYGLQGLGCSWNWPPFEHRMALLAIYGGTLIVLALLLLGQVRAARRQPERLRQSAVIATTTAIVATVVTFAPTFFASACL